MKLNHDFHFWIWNTRVLVWTLTLKIGGGGF